MAFYAPGHGEMGLRAGARGAGLAVLGDSSLGVAIAKVL